MFIFFPFFFFFSLRNWSPGTPEAGDDVIINLGEAPCTTLLAVLKVDVITPALGAVLITSPTQSNVITIIGEGPREGPKQRIVVGLNCKTVVKVDGALNADTVSVESPGTKLIVNGTINAATSFTSAEGTFIQGTGTIEAPRSTIAGYLMPGRSVKGTCPACWPDWFSSDITGDFTINGSVTIPETGRIWIKLLSSKTYDRVIGNGHLVFDGIVELEFDWNQDIAGAEPLSFVSVSGTFTITVGASYTPSIGQCVSELICPCGAVANGPPSELSKRAVGSSVNDECPDGPSLVTNSNQLVGGSAPGVCGTSSGGTIGVILSSTCSGGIVQCAAGFVNVGNSCVAFCLLFPYCSGHGACQSASLVPFCQCNALQDGFGWTGEFCDAPLCKNKCNGIHGTCKSDAAVPYCECNGPYSGNDCTVPTCDPTCVNGVCDGSSGTPLCDCNAGYGGDDCSQEYNTTCPPCGANGNCPVNATICACDPGYTGSQCNILVCPKSPETSMNCDSNGDCIGGVCSCYEGFDGPSCSDRNCTASYCNNGGTCYPTLANQLACQCPPSFTGSFCQFVKSTSFSSSPESDSLMIIYIAVPIAVIVIGVIIALSIVLYKKVSTKKMTKNMNNQLAAQSVATY